MWLTDLDWVGVSGEIVGITPIQEENVFDLSFGPDSFHITNVENFNPPSNFTNIYELQVRHDVPEPATLALFGIGLFSIRVLRRNRRKAKDVSFGT